MKEMAGYENPLHGARGSDEPHEFRVRPPQYAGNAALDDVPLSVFDPIVACIRSQRHAVIPLHQGKTAFTSPLRLRGWPSGEFDYEPHHDGPSAGAETLIAAISQKLSRSLGTDIDPRRIQVTNGITHALSVVFHSVLAPGDEVLVLSPQWLFVNGLVRAAQGNPVEVPFFTWASGSAALSLSDSLTPYITDRTRAIYFNAPNNPSGRSISERGIDELTAFALERGLWLVADNAYEDFDFSQAGFVDAAATSAGESVTFAAYSFSKSFGLTGYRIGYLLSPSDMAERARKFSLYSIYSVPTSSQFIATEALSLPAEVLGSHREFVQKSLAMTSETLTVPCSPPDGGFYAFLDLSEWEKGADDFIYKCIGDGVSLAPGRAFGTRYAAYARLCFAAVPHEALVEGVRIVNAVFTRGY